MNRVMKKLIVFGLINIFLLAAPLWVVTGYIMGDVGELLEMQKRHWVVTQKQEARLDLFREAFEIQNGINALNTNMTVQIVAMMDEMAKRIPADPITERNKNIYIVPYHQNST